MSEISEQARGRWPMILAALGVEEQYLRKRNGPCPECGGKDRYRFTDHHHRGMWWCSQCDPNTGDGFDLLRKVHGWTFSEAAAEVEKLMPGLPPSEQEQAEAKRARAAEKLNAVRKEAVAAAAVPDVVRYLRGRGLIVPPGLEAHRAMPYYRDGIRQGDYPVMLGKVVLPSGKPVTYHRTYLHQGRKAPVDTPRKLMNPTRNSKGGAIQLWPKATVLGIAEGIETAIAAHLMFGLPVWSVVSANGMQEFHVPEGVDEVVVFGDCDRSFTGQAAAYRAARRFVLDLGIQARVEIPTEWGDWNDVLLQQRRSA